MKCGRGDEGVTVDGQAGGDDGSDDVPVQVRGWGSIQLLFFLFL